MERTLGTEQLEVADNLTLREVQSQLPDSRLHVYVKMTKLQAREALRDEVTKRTGQNLGGRVHKDSSVTFEWLVLNRYFPLRKGDWRPETAKEKMAHVRLDLIDRFGDHPNDSFDKFTLQTHLNSLAERYSQAGKAGEILPEVHLRAGGPSEGPEPEAADS